MQQMRGRVCSAWLSAGAVVALFAGTATVPGMSEARAAGEGAKAEKILFVSTGTGEGKLNIFTMNPDGSEAANLTKSKAVEFDPAWSPDRTKIAFVVADPGKKVADIYVMNADGSQRTALTHSEAGFFAFGPAWSPDGKRIAYSTIQNPGAGPPDVALFVMDADGKNEKTLGDGVLPVWSPDGKKIVYDAFVNEGEKIPAISVMDADGTNARKLAEKGIASAWSPDGKRILYSSEGGGDQADLFVMDADGAHATQLTHTADEMEFGSQWSADGKRIFFTRFQKGPDPKPRIYVMEADGSNVQPLTKSDAIGFLGPGSGMMIMMSHIEHAGAPAPGD